MNKHKQRRADFPIYFLAAVSLTMFPCENEHLVSKHRISQFVVFFCCFWSYCLSRAYYAEDEFSELAKKSQRNNKFRWIKAPVELIPFI